MEYDCRPFASRGLYLGPIRNRVCGPTIDGNFEALTLTTRPRWSVGKVHTCVIVFYTFLAFCFQDADNLSPARAIGHLEHFHFTVQRNGVVLLCRTTAHRCRGDASANGASAAAQSIHSVRRGVVCIWCANSAG